MQIKSYQKYIESGIKWIGEIPEGWEVRKIKHISNTVAGGTPSTANLEYWDGDIPWLPSGMVHNNIIGHGDVFKFITLEGLNNSSTKKIRKDSPLIALTGATCGNIAYLIFEATANQSVVGMETNKKSNAKYLYYYLISQREQILINKTGGAQSGINEQNVKDIFCSYPSLTEQIAIANFLDKKIAKTDVLIEKDKRLIELLKEKRTALINHTVTKGLDSNAKLKDSGIEWIGKIPEEWEVRKVKQFSKIITGSTPESGNNAYWDGDLKWITPADLSIRKKYISDSKRKITKEGFASCGTTFVNKGTIVLATRAPIGYPTIVKEKLCFNQGCKAFEIEKDFTSDYCYYYLNAYENVLNSKGNATTFSELSMYDLASFPVLKPSQREQLQITQYLDKNISQIDKTIQKIEQKINLLEEYKKSLIHHVVTGKIDVRGSGI